MSSRMAFEHRFLRKHFTPVDPPISCLTSWIAVGSTYNVFKVLFCRLKYNASQTDPDWLDLGHDLTLINDHLEPRLQRKRGKCVITHNDNHLSPPHASESPILWQTLLSNPALMSVMVDLLSLLLLKPQLTAGFAIWISYPLIIISKCSDIRGYHCILHLMNTSIISLIPQLSRICGSDESIRLVTSHIIGNISALLMYRALIGSVGRNIDLALPGGEASHRQGEISWTNPFGS